MLAPKISARAKHPNKTQTFVTAVQTAMDIFEDQIRSLSRDICLKAYKTLVHSYKTALTAVWNSAPNANITLILETVQDKAMSELTEMAKQLQIPPPTVEVIKEKRDVPTLETITGLMLAKIPTQNMPNTAVCEKIGFIFSKLSEASKAYGEAAEALAQVSADVSPEHYMLLLSATATPTIQIVVPPMMLSPIIAAPPLSPDASTTSGRTAIINATKVKFYQTQIHHASQSATTTLPQGSWQPPFTQPSKESSLTPHIQEWSSSLPLSVTYHNCRKPSPALNTAQAHIITNLNQSRNARQSWVSHQACRQRKHQSQSPKPRHNQHRPSIF